MFGRHLPTEERFSGGKDLLACERRQGLQTAGLGQIVGRQSGVLKASGELRGLFDRVPGEISKADALPRFHFPNRQPLGQGVLGEQRKQLIAAIPRPHFGREQAGMISGTFQPIGTHSLGVSENTGQHSASGYVATGPAFKIGRAHV